MPRYTIEPCHAGTFDPSAIGFAKYATTMQYMIHRDGVRILLRETLEEAQRAVSALQAADARK